jgi:hypothetical protein
MDYKYKVVSWVLADGDHNYKHTQNYSGKSLIAALRAMIKAKKTSSCVTFKWQ